jgi:hypothetical protein
MVGIGRITRKSSSLLFANEVSFNIVKISSVIYEENGRKGNPVKKIFVIVEKCVI